MTSATETGTSSPEAWLLEGVTRSQLVRYAGASGDFNPIHHDDEIARAAGHPSVIAHGMFTAGVLASYLERWLGTGKLRKFQVRFRARVFPGDTLTFTATVVETRDGEADIACSVVRQDGEVAVEGTATAAL